MLLRQKHPPVVQQAPAWVPKSQLPLARVARIDLRATKADLGRHLLGQADFRQGPQAGRIENNRKLPGKSKGRPAGGVGRQGDARTGELTQVASAFFRRIYRKPSE